MRMDKRFRRGLVVGKFCPLHRGHELLIGRAVAQCDEVLVISYTLPEFAGCKPARRDAWLAQRFPHVRRLVLDAASLQTHCRQRGVPLRAMPHNDAPADLHRQFCAWLCRDLLQLEVDAVFTSEDYGDGFAEALGAYFTGVAGVRREVRHVCVDRARVEVPVSGTMLRDDPHLLRAFLAPEVYADFVRRACFLGGESSGKTTLAQALAQRCATAWAPEFGRELWEKQQGQLRHADMLTIARTQVAREESLGRQANGWLFCDTSPLTTLFYSECMFGAAEPELHELAGRRYDLVFLCAPDFPFVQDGTRRDGQFRERQHAWYADALARRAMPHIALHGSLDKRIDTILRHLG